jgi:hypothetical protein
LIAIAHRRCRRDDGNDELTVILSSVDALLADGRADVPGHDTCLNCAPPPSAARGRHPAC